MSDAGPIRALGIDAGSTTMKMVGVDADGALVLHVLEDMDPRIEAQAERLVAEAVAQGCPADAPVVATGYGRNLISRATRRVTEITCHARGVHRQVGHGGTLIDIGGQDSKVIVVGDDGKVVNFSMNDKCAAGTGRFLEVVSGRLRMPMETFAETALSTEGEVAISSTCTVFAESEMISLIARGEPVEHIVRGLHRSLIRRVSALARSAGVQPPLMLSGGVARSSAVRALLADTLGHEIVVPPHPQLMGAYGAALFALGAQAGAAAAAGGA